MNLRRLWLPIAALTGALAYSYISRPVSPSSSLRVNAEPVAAAAEVTPAPPPIVTSPIAASKPLAELIPKKEDMRHEVELDPHSTPKALLKFSIDLYNRETAAKASEEKAKSFFAELQSCALEGAGMHSVEALCLLNAKRLVSIYPSLSDDYQRLETQADPKAVGLMRHMPL